MRAFLVLVLFLVSGCGLNTRLTVEQSGCDHSEIVIQREGELKQ